MAEFSKPTMALFVNITAADLKKGNIIMFAIWGLVLPAEWPPEWTDV